MSLARFDEGGIGLETSDPARSETSKPSAPKDMKEKSDLRAIALVGIDGVLYLSTMVLILWVESMVGKFFLSALVAPVLLSRLQVLGHDLGHRSIGRSPFIQKFLGRLAFIPTLHAFSIWEYFHNGIHHSHTNVHGKDYAWSPLSPGEFSGLSWLKKRLYRLERSVWGHGIWVWRAHFYHRGFFPKKCYIGRRRRIYDLDCLLVIFGNLAMFAGLIALSHYLHVRWGGPEQGAAAIAIWAFLIPSTVFAWMFGWMIYVQHTAPEVPWFKLSPAMSFESHQSAVTPSWIYPRWFGLIFHFIHLHTAHHRNTRTAHSGLEKAQSELIRSDRSLPQNQFSVSMYLDIIRRCKLFDFENSYWCDFEGAQTGPGLDPFNARSSCRKWD